MAGNMRVRTGPALVPEAAGAGPAGMLCRDVSAAKGGRRPRGDTPTVQRGVEALELATEASAAATLSGRSFLDHKRVIDLRSGPGRPDPAG